MLRVCARQWCKHPHCRPYTDPALSCGFQYRFRHALEKFQATIDPRPAPTQGLACLLLTHTTYFQQLPDQHRLFQRLPFPALISRQSRQQAPSCITVDPLNPHLVFPASFQRGNPVPSVQQRETIAIPPHQYRFLLANGFHRPHQATQHGFIHQPAICQFLIQFVDFYFDQVSSQTFHNLITLNICSSLWL